MKYPFDGFVGIIFGLDMVNYTHDTGPGKATICWKVVSIFGS